MLQFHYSWDLKDILLKNQNLRLIRLRNLCQPTSDMIIIRSRISSYKTSLEGPSQTFGLDNLWSCQRSMTHQLRTINIITEDINFELLEENVKLIDLLWRVNKMKPQSEQIHPKEFHNDAINNSVDLKP